MRSHRQPLHGLFFPFFFRDWYLCVKNFKIYNSKKKEKKKRRRRSGGGTKASCVATFFVIVSSFFFFFSNLKWSFKAITVRRRCWCSYTREYNLDQSIFFKGISVRRGSSIEKSMKVEDARVGICGCVGCEGDERERENRGSNKDPLSV